MGHFNIVVVRRFRHGTAWFVFGTQIGNKAVLCRKREQSESRLDLGHSESQDLRNSFSDSEGTASTSAAPPSMWARSYFAGGTKSKCLTSQMSCI